MSARGLIFCTVFAAAACFIYILAMELNWAAFTYHPRIREFGWGAEPSRNGPAMYWYGWMTTSILSGAVVAALASVMLPHVPQRVLLTLGWIVPALAMLAVIYFTLPFFTKD